MFRNLFLLLFCCTSLLAQKPIFHLVIAADVEDNAYTVRNFSKEEKLKYMFEVVSRELDYSLKIKYLHTPKFGFSAKGVLDTLGKIKTFTPNDIVVFYYLGRGYYPKPSDKVPLLEFQDTKNMLSFEQIRKKMTSLNSRLNLVIADCDESYTLLNPNQLPHSLIRTGQVEQNITDFDKNLFASLDNAFSSFREAKFNESPIFFIENNKNDSTYLEQCLLGLDSMINNKTKLKLDLNSLKHISILSEIVSSYNINGYPRNLNVYQQEDLQKLKKKDKFNHFRTFDVNIISYRLLVDSLFLKRNITDFNDSLNILIRDLIEYEKKPMLPLNWKNESEERIIYYFEIKNELELILANKKSINPKFRPEHLRSILQRLEKYNVYGFPKENSNYRKEAFQSLPIISKANFKNIDFGPNNYYEVIDSLFIKRKILVREDPINILLDSLIEFENRPLIRPIEFLSQSQVDYYYETLDKLDFLRNISISSDQDSSIKKRNEILFNRLESYRTIGFPEKNVLEVSPLSDSKINNINQNIDVLYNQKLLLNQDHFLHLRLDSLIDYTLSIHTLKLEKSDFNYFIQQKKELDSLHKIFVNGSITNEMILIAIERLNEYSEFGFPSTDQNYQHQIESIKFGQFFYREGYESPYPIRNKFYSPIIDSLYLTNQILNLDSPLYNTLRVLIENNLPAGNRLLGSMTAKEPLTNLVIRQLFLSECGMIEIASGHKTALSKNQYIGNFTEHIIRNFNDLSFIFRPEELETINLQRVFSPLNSPFIFHYKKTNSKKCPLGSAENLVIPDFKKLPTEQKVNDLFTAYVKTNSQTQKKSLKTEIKTHFENNATLKVKPLLKDRSQPAGLLNLNIDDYFVKLDKKNPQVDSVGVKQGSMKRNRNFSKITTMMVVEN